MSKKITLDWVLFNQDNNETYPPEGIEVLISGLSENGNILYDVAWYLKSSKYVCMKTDIEEDEANVFTAFVPLRWRAINYIDVKFPNNRVRTIDNMDHLLNTHSLYKKNYNTGIENYLDKVAINYL